MRYLLLVALAVAAIALGWFLLSDPATPERTAVEMGPNADAAMEGATGGELDRLQSVPDVERQVVAPAAAEVMTADQRGADAPEEHPFSGQLAGVTGRVVEADGTPAPGLRVELLQVAADSFLGDSHVVQPLDSIDVGKATTDAEGRFTIGGALGTGFHGLGIDLGGVRATLRFIDESLNYAELADLGDIQLAEFATVFGVVIDDDGEPVEGARVRLATMPEVVVQSGVLEMRAESKVALRERSGAGIADPPQWLGSLIDRLPVSTAHTNAEGEFRMEGVPVGRVSGGVDRAGSAATVISGFELKAGEVRDHGELELLEGRSMQGRVLDAMGEPLRGVEVFVGALQPLLGFGFLQPADSTNADGEFSSTGVPELGTVIVAVRRSSSEPWVIAEFKGAQSGVVVRLPVASRAAFELVDKATDEAVDGARVAVVPVPVMEGTNLADLFARAHRGTLDSLQAAPQGDGRYEIEALPIGRWEIQVELPGYATHREVFSHEPGGNERRIPLERGVAWHLRATDASTGEPIARAHVSAVALDGSAFRALASGWTDEEGLVSVGPLSESEPEENTFTGFQTRGRRWVIQHPRYGRTGLSEGALVTSSGGGQVASGDAPRGVSPEAPIELRLSVPTQVSGRVTWNDGAPGMRYMVIFNDDDPLSTAVPRLAVTDSEGFYSIKGLAPGDYFLELMQRFETRDPLDFLPKMGGVAPLYREQLLIVGGEADRTLNIKLEGDGGPKNARIEGIVRVDGVPVVGASVKLGPHGESLCRTDGAGRFRTGELEPQSTTIMIMALDPSQPDGGDEEVLLYAEYTTLTSGNTTVIDMNVTFRELRVLVLDADDSKPIAEATVGLPGSGQATTGSDGVARLRVRRLESSSAGKVEEKLARARMSVSAEGYGRVTNDAPSFAGDGPTRLEVRLPRVVLCAGTVVFAGDSRAESRPPSGFSVSGLGASEGQGAWVKIDPASLRFESSDLPPGSYQAEIHRPEGNATATFELPPGGNEDLTLNFVE